jgi:gelsolin
MSGLVKAKKYDWKDSNMALFGSDTEKQVKKESACAEPAWEGAGQEVGIQIWRIVKFKVDTWPEEDYGKFFSGDSYIILNTYKPDPGSEELAWDVHFWIGSQSTQDEYGTAAYKTVELDTYLDDAAIQHREVQGKTSALFRTYFKTVTIMEGGADSGFRHVGPEAYTPRLLHFSGLKKNIVVKEVPCNRARLNSDDVFILDLGTQLYQWNGTGCNKDEKFKAMQYLQKLRSERGKATSETLEEADTPESHPFYDFLTADDEEDEEADVAGEKELFKVSDASGDLTFEQVKTGDVTIDDFQSGDVFILDCGDECFVWVGSEASPSEKQNALGYAHNHLMKSSHALVPITVIKEGQNNADFNAAIGA